MSIYVTVFILITASSRVAAAAILFDTLSEFGKLIVYRWVLLSLFLTTDSSSSDTSGDD